MHWRGVQALVEFVSLPLLIHFFVLFRSLVYRGGLCSPQGSGVGAAFACDGHGTGEGASGPPIQVLLRAPIVMGGACSKWLEATPRIELGIEVLQTSALPLGYVAAPSSTRFYR